MRQPKRSTRCVWQLHWESDHIVAQSAKNRSIECSQFLGFDVVFQGTETNVTAILFSVRPVSTMMIPGSLT